MTDLKIYFNRREVITKMETSNYVKHSLASSPFSQKPDGKTLLLTAPTSYHYRAKQLFTSMSVEYHKFVNG